jgi:hypothetical protein
MDGDAERALDVRDQSLLGAGGDIPHVHLARAARARRVGQVELRPVPAERDLANVPRRCLWGREIRVDDIVDEGRGEIGTVLFEDIAGCDGLRVRRGRYLPERQGERDDDSEADRPHGHHDLSSVCVDLCVASDPKCPQKRERSQGRNALPAANLAHA